MQPVQTTLPSVVAAEKFIRGEPGGFPSVLASTLGRSFIIAGGLYLAGENRPGRLLRNSLFAAAAIEVFVLMRVQAQLKART